MKLLEKFKFTILLIVCIGYFNATGVEALGQNCYNRYVSTQGSNANNGTQSAPYLTIQYAIDQVCVGDTVFVEEGTYVENINFNGKDIVVTSMDCPELTIIDGNQNGSVVTFRNGETNNAVLNGFTITNGTGTLIEPINSSLGSYLTGGGVLVHDFTSPTLQNLIVEGNTAQLGGGIGIAYNWGLAQHTIVKNCHINNNDVTELGGGLSCIGGSNAEVSNSLFYRNTARLGSAISSNYTSSIDLLNNTISNNIATQNGVIHLANQSTIQAENCIIWWNTPSNIFWEGGINATSTIDYSNVENGGGSIPNVTWGTSNIYVPGPDFTNAASDDYTLLSTSPCIDTGSTNTPPMDINGTVRPQGGGMDMGAYEHGGNPINPCCPYAIRTETIDCVQEGDIICVYLDAIQPVPSNVTGLDYCLSYDPVYVTPVSGVSATLGNVVTNGGPSTPAYFGYIDNVNHNVHTSIYYQGSGNLAMTTGDVICIEFIVNSLPSSGGVLFEACEVRESYPTGVVEQCANDGILTLLPPERDGQLIYWDDVIRPIYDVSGNTQTAIYGKDAACENTIGIYSVNASGYFNTTDAFIDIDRQIIPDDYYTPLPPNPTPCLPVTPVLTSFDCVCLGFITTFNTNVPPPCNFINDEKPNPFQMLAGDVNMDDKLSAGDITAIQQRVILDICEYPQAWNYDINGTPLVPYAPSKDWRFVDANTALSADYINHIDYPNFPPSPGNGYWRDDVPDIPACLPTYIDSCKEDTLKYHGVLLGDIDGTWQATLGSGLKKAVDIGQLILETDGVAMSEEKDVYQIAVKINSQEIIYALDLIIEYNPEILTVEAVKNAPQTEVDQFNTAFNIVGNTLRLSSYTLAGSQTDEILFYIMVRLNDGEAPQYEDLGDVQALLNGVESEIVTTFVSINTPLSSLASITVYPNPVKDRLQIQWKTPTYVTKSVRLFNTLGQLVRQVDLNEAEQQIEMDVSSLDSGMYFMTVYENGEPVGSTKILK